MAFRPLTYSQDEIVGHLPTGWTISDSNPAGIWDAQKTCWTVFVADGADVEWRLEVYGSQAAQHGRIEALKLAIDRLYRSALG